MKRTGWTVLDFVLAAIVAVLGNIVASFLQDDLSLTDPIRFALVAIRLDTIPVVAGVSGYT